MRVSRQTIEWFAAILQTEFCLEYPVKIVQKKFLNIEENGKSFECWGLYYSRYSAKGNLKSHKIEFCNRCEIREIFATIAHEYVHAWQEENELKLGHTEQKQFRIWHEYFLEYYQADIIKML